MDRQKYNKPIIQDLSTKYDLPPDIIEDILQSPFIFLKKKMREFNLLPVRLKYFGTFLMYAGGMRWLPHRYKQLLDMGVITPQEYDQRMAILATELLTKDAKHTRKQLKAPNKRPS